jgi:hypothetical protein
MNDQLRRAVSLARRGIDGRHSEPHRLALFELIRERAVHGLAGAEEEHRIAINRQAIAAGGRLPGQK